MRSRASEPSFTIMRTTLLLGLVWIALAACAAPAPVASPAAPPSPPSPPSPAARGASEEESRSFFEAIRAEKDDRALQLLVASPALANARDAKGRSAFHVALSHIVGGDSFVPPQENRVLAAILANRPALDAFEAAAAGDEARVRAELDKDPGYVERRHATGWTPIHFAAFGGQPAIVELLLARGAEVDVRAKNRFDNTPLHVCLLTKQVAVARVLLRHGAAVDAQQAEGFTALHEAAFSGDAPSAAALLDAGADPTLAGGPKKLTALQVATERHHDEVAALLRSRAKPR
jgi:ankyrin repeat protein